MAKVPRGSRKGPERNRSPLALCARTVFDNLLEGCQVIGFDWRYRYVNEAVARQGRRSPEELVGRSMLEAYPRIERTTMFSLLKRSMEERTHHRMENEFTFPDGSTAWFDLRFEPVPDGVFILSLEITDKRRAEIERERSQRTLKAIFEGARDGILVTDVETKRFTVANAAACRMLGYGRDEVLGLSVRDIHSPEDLPEALGQLERQIRGEAALVTDIPVRRRDGSVFFADIHSTPVEIGGRLCLVGIFRDITDRRSSADRIAHLNAVLRGIRDVNQLITREKDRDRLIGAACDVLVEARGFHAVLIGLTGGSGKVASYAGAGRHLAALKEMLGRGEAPECVRRALAARDSVTVRDPRRSCVECPCAAEAGEDWDAVALALEQDGRQYGCLLVFLPAGLGGDPEEQELLREAAGDIAFALRRIEGDAERGALEEQLRQAQKLEAVGRLAGGLAHDFNNMLSAILGYCDLVRRKLVPGDPIAEDLGQIRQSGERAASLTRQLLAFSRKQILEPRVIDLNEVVRGLEGMLGRLIGEDVELVVRPAAEPGFVKADPGQIEQVVMNLAVNARDAMPGGGRLTIETRNGGGGREAGGEEADPGPHVMLVVTDTGCGMDEETLSNIFEPFFTTKARGKGTGLGLSTVYGIVKQSGGDVRVLSEPGKGATFEIVLPRAEECPKEPARTGRSVPALCGTETILAVEDEPLLRDLIGRILEAGGYRVLLAADGNEALDLCRRHGDEIALVLTDVVMPNVGGRALADELERLLPRVKVVYTSGYTDDAIVHHGVLDADVPLIKKPYQMNVLLSKVRELLDAP